MELISMIRDDAPGGVVLTTTLDCEPVTVFVVVAPPELELLPDIVGEQAFSPDSQVHANAVAAGDDVEDKLLEVLENMNPGDTAVFLCEAEAVRDAVLDALGIVEEN